MGKKGEVYLLEKVFPEKGRTRTGTELHITLWFRKRLTGRTVL